MTIAQPTLFEERKRANAEAIPLYDFQREALDAVHANRAKGITRSVIVIPTGGGKTLTAVHLIAEVGLPAVFICHREELVDQTRKKLREFDPSTTVAICKAEQGREIRDLAGRDVVIASAQTLAHERRLNTLVQAVGTGGLTIVDESHHSMAVSWERAIRTLDPSLLVGLTATPKRGDGKGLDTLFQEIAYSVPMKRLVERGLLARPIGIAIGTDVNLDDVHSATGDFKKNELEVVVNTTARNRLVVDAYEKYAADRKRAVAFCVDRAHVRALTEAFTARGHKAAYVLGDTPKDERRDIYRRFADASLNVLVNCEVLTEGWDEPKAECALMCRPTQSQSLYQQMAGRVLRKAEGKSNALILDFVDLTRKHDLQTILTLAGAEGRELGAPKDGELLDLFGDIGNAQQRKARVLASSERLGDLLGESPFLWHSSGAQSFVSCGNDQWLAIVPRGEGFIPIRLAWPRDGEASYEVLFKRPVDADTAMNIAQNLVPRTKLTDRNAGWRVKDEPATDAQSRLASFLRISITGMTKGEASAQLDQAKFERAIRRSKALTEVSA